jgi:hypothetical protein
LARAVGDVPPGGYVLASMSLQAGLNDFRDGTIVGCAHLGPALG